MRQNLENFLEKIYQQEMNQVTPKIPKALEVNAETLPVGPF